MRGQLRIDQVYAFIVLDDDGTEGIPALAGRDGMAIPMVGADLTRVEQLYPAARAMAAQMNKTITLALFTHRENKETFGPPPRPVKVV